MHTFAQMQHKISIQTRKPAQKTYVYGLFILFQGLIHAYMAQIYAYIAMNTLTCKLNCIYIYIYIYIYEYIAEIYIYIYIYAA